MEEKRELNDPIALLIKAKGAGFGSGFFIGENLIATNIHVVAGATSISAELIGTNTPFMVEGVAAFDAKNDLVILKITGEGIPIPIGDSDLVENGDIVQTVGYPNEKYKVTKGTTIHSISDSDKWLRMKVKAAKGNSGGPVLNCKGQVIGIHTRGGDFYGYAIPSKALKDLLNQSKSTQLLNLEQWYKEKVSSAYCYYIQAQEIEGRKNSTEKRVTYLDAAIQLYPDYTEFHSKRGAAKLSLGQSKDSIEEAQSYYKEAIKDYTHVLQLDSKPVEAYNNLGIVKYYLGKSEDARGNVTKAQRYCQEAIKDHTNAITLCLNYAPAYERRAHVRHLLGKYKENEKNKTESQKLYTAALSDMNSAIEKCSCSAEFYYTRAEIKVALGNLSGAKDDYCSTLERNPNHVKARYSYEHVKKCLSQKGV